MDLLFFLIDVGVSASKKASSYLASQGVHGRVKAICGAVVAVIAGIVKFQYFSYSSSSFFTGIPLPGSFPSLLGFACLFPFTGSILAIFAGQILESSAIKKLTRSPVEGIFVDVIVGIVCGLIAAMLFLPLGGD